MTINKDKVLFPVTDNSMDAWTIDDAVKGVSIMGGTGSGKTTASGSKIALSYLREGWGGIVLCAKTEEVELWRNYCADTNRTNDLIVFEKGGKLSSGEEMVFNPIDYEMRRAGEGAGETQNLTNIFMNIYRMGNRISGEGDTKEERYWDNALKRCLNRVIELIKLAEEDLSYSNMVGVLNTCGNVDPLVFEDIINQLTDKEAPEEEYQKNINQISNELKEPDQYCMKCLVDAYYNTEMSDLPTSKERTQAFNMVKDYFTVTMPRMEEKTKSVVTESFMGIAEPFLTGLLFRHFSGKTNLHPEWTYTRQSIIVLNFPIKEFLDAGIIAQSVFKLLFQQALERRPKSENPQPVFLWCDEAQYFINPYDQLFLTTARSSKVATVFLSQNISNYLAIMGKGQEAKAQVDSLMGNLCTKIFHANSDAETNEYASRLIGSVMKAVYNESTQYNHTSLMPNHSEGMSTQLMAQLTPRDFTMLSTGGKDNKVHGIMVVSGKQWSDGDNFQMVTWNQKFYN